MRRLSLILLAAVALLLSCCHDAAPPRSTPPAKTPKAEPPPFTPGTDIVILGRRIDIGWPVVLWNDPVLLRDGKPPYNAYATTCRDLAGDYPLEVASRPSRQSKDILRWAAREPSRLSGPAARAVRTNGWTESTLRDQICQFVLHYDAVGSSARCFRGLHDVRGLSVHFMVDLDGTIWQTMDVRDKAFHAGEQNDESVGVEIASVGAFPNAAALDHYYVTEGATVRHAFPPGVDWGLLQRRDVIPAPATPDLKEGRIHGRLLFQRDYTTLQYEALFHLGGALCREFQKIRTRYPVGPDGKLLRTVIPESERARWGGVVGHWHLSNLKTDPGPAMDFDLLLEGIRTWITRRPNRSSK